jgi:hypothetical protein
MLSIVVEDARFEFLRENVIGREDAVGDGVGGGKRRGGHYIHTMRIKRMPFAGESFIVMAFIVWLLYIDLLTCGLKTI